MVSGKRTKTSVKREHVLRGHIPVLNTHELRELNKELEQIFGFTVPKSFVFIQAGDNKIHITTRRIDDINLNALKVARIGMYFCTRDKYGVRLSIEGTQLFKDKICKNIIDITPQQQRSWLFGKDLELSAEQCASVMKKEGEQEEDGKSHSEIFVVRCGEDFCGCGRIKQGNILQNFVPKERRTGTIE